MLAERDLSSLRELQDPTKVLSWCESGLGLLLMGVNSNFTFVNTWANTGGCIRDCDYWVLSLTLEKLRVEISKLVPVHAGQSDKHQFRSFVCKKKNKRLIPWIKLRTGQNETCCCQVCSHCTMLGKQASAPLSVNQRWFSSEVSRSVTDWLKQLTWVRRLL